MISVIDVGNTTIELGLIEDGKIILSESIATDLNRTGAEYSVLLNELLDIHDINPDNIEGCIISSVVPPLDYELKTAVKKVIKKTPLFVEPGTKTGVNLKMENPKTLGADILVGAVAVKELYSYPAIMIDMGTATTMMVLDKEGDFIGGVVMPGVGVSLNALSNNASKLPKINLSYPNRIINTLTDECMQSGIINGQAAMIDGVIEMMEEELGYPCTVIATGGLARVIIPHCKKAITLDNDLNLKGLEILYKKNA